MPGIHPQPRRFGATEWRHSIRGFIPPERCTLRVTLVEYDDLETEC
jgi:hypothetical protein